MPQPQDMRDMRDMAYPTAWVQEKDGRAAIEGEAGASYPDLKRYRRTLVWLPNQYVLVLDDTHHQACGERRDHQIDDAKHFPGDHIIGKWPEANAANNYSKDGITYCGQQWIGLITKRRRNRPQTQLRQHFEKKLNQ